MVVMVPRRHNGHDDRPEDAHSARQSCEVGCVAFTGITSQGCWTGCGMAYRPSVKDTTDVTAIRTAQIRNARIKVGRSGYVVNTNS